MKIKPFAVEEWMNEYEDNAKYNIAETCVHSVSLKELFDLTGENLEDFLNQIANKRLTYGNIFGAPELLSGITKLYKTLTSENIVPTHGAAGANHHVFISLINPGDHVISILPTYQQLYSIPESIGAKLDTITLKKEENYKLNIQALKSMVTPKTKMICINNPNNPTGALLSYEELTEIVNIAREVGAYLMCDETYRHLTQNEKWCHSVADLYEKGISVSSMSKVFSLAGIRLGWIATKNPDTIKKFLTHRDYNLISCGMIDEAIAIIALKHSDKIIERNKKMVQTNLEILDKWVQSEPYVKYVKPQAGTTALIYYSIDKLSLDFCKEMYYKTGAFVTPGSCFDEEYCFRIGYACDTPILVDGLKAVSEYIKTLV